MSDSLESLINTWIRPEIQAISSYHVPESAHLIKLDAMENPYVWEAEMQTAWLERLRGVTVNRYPDPGARAVKSALRPLMQVPENSGLILGNGSDELIQMLTLALALEGGKALLLAPEPSFVMYKMLAQVCGMKYLGVPLQAHDFTLNIEAMLSAIKTHQPALIFLAYPNNPTGNLFERSAVERIISAAPGLVVVDEAYCAFAEDTFMPALEQYPNLLVMRTLSKIGLAGLRLGLLAGHPAWLAQLEKTRLPYNINSLSQASVIFALEHYEQFLAQSAQIRSARSLVFRYLQDLPAVQAWHSQANFILFRVLDAPKTFAAIKAQGVLIKNLHGSHPLLDQCLRVTVGKPEENRAFLDALRHAL